MNLLPLAIGTLLVAFFTGSDSLFYLAYTLVGISLLTRFWTRSALKSVQVTRRISPRAFYGERIVAELHLHNRSILPVPWLHLHESIPIALHSPNFEQRILSLAPRERITLNYKINCSRRGYHEIGPLQLKTGDLLGVVPEFGCRVSTTPVIVYPRIIPLHRLGMPSQLPFGTLASRQRIFQDPSRFFGVRDYEPSDSLRLINWKSSARLDHLQTKRFQPAIALNTVIFLDLNLESYNVHSRTESEEMGVVVAASFAVYLSERRQQVGLVVLGRDEVTGFTGLHNIRPAHGREHLVRILEVLARAGMAETGPLSSLLPAAGAHLGWGSTAIVIISGEQAGLLPALLRMQRQGLAVVVIATDPRVPFKSFESSLGQAGILAHLVTQDRDMDKWR
jgi:uncharacterized protein (DUF58 family)